MGFLFTINNYIGNVEKTIVSDGVGYYDYLPSIIIHHDFNRKEKPRQENPKFYNRIEHSIGAYVDYKDYLVNKYPSGTALLLSPFFTYAYLSYANDGEEFTGYEAPFHRAVFYAAIFYLFLTLILLKKVLQLYKVRNGVILFCQIILVFATSLTHYTNAEASFSHVYSLFAISLFIYFAKLFFTTQKMNYFLLSSVVFGLIFLLRNPNILIVFILPFLAGSKAQFLAGLKVLWLNKLQFLMGALIAFLVISVQLVAWHFQTNDFLVYSYQGEGFKYLFNPKIFDILFSYKKGLFIYTPVLLLATLCLSWFVFKKRYYFFFSWFFFFLVLTYVLSSWHSWFYGCSYGLRAYIDYYILFFIPFAIVVDRSKKHLKSIIVSLALITIPINIIQTYQYKEFILHWDNMDEKKYWKVFLKTADKYRGLIWKNNDQYKDEWIEKEVVIGDVALQKNETREVYTLFSYNLSSFDKISTVQILIEDKFLEADNSSITLSIVDSLSGEVHYWHEVYSIHYHEAVFNEWQTGYYNYKFEPINSNSPKKLTITLHSDEEKVFHNLQIKLIEKIRIKEPIQ